MKILVVSDVHERPSALYAALRQQPDAHTVFFLGDGLRTLEQAAAEEPHRRFLAVRGNCDWGVTGYPDTGVEQIGPVRIFYTHGHLFGVKSDTDQLEYTARQAGASVLLYGHTHRPQALYRDGLHILCPGALADGAYGLLELGPGGVLLQTCRTD